MVFEFRPKNTGHIEKFKTVRCFNPLFINRNARSIFYFCLFSACDLIDKGRFTNVGDTNDHSAQGFAVHTLGIVFFKCFGTDSLQFGDDLVHALSCDEVAHDTAFFVLTEVTLPLGCDIGIGKGGLGKNNEARFIGTNFINFGVLRGSWDSGVKNFNYGIDERQAFRHHTSCFCHMSGEPLNNFRRHNFYFLYVTVFCLLHVADRREGE